VSRTSRLDASVELIFDSTPGIPPLDLSYQPSLNRAISRAERDPHVTYIFRGPDARLATAVVSDLVNSAVTVREVREALYSVRMSLWEGGRRVTGEKRRNLGLEGGP
jgi:hypothetical protein